MTDKKKTVSSLKTRRRRFKITAIITTVLLLGILVFATMFAYGSSVMYDMTKDKVFTMSEQTEDMLSGLGEQVDIGVVYPRGKEDPLLKSLLEVYAKNSAGMIRVEYIDAELEPGLLAKYNLNLAAVTNGTIIVQSAKRTKIINVVSLYATTQMGNSFSGERHISGAVKFVTASKLPKVYFVQGHSEADLDDVYSKLRQYIEAEAYMVETINLVGVSEMPDDAAVVICASPKSDYSKDEVRVIEDYIEAGGSTMFLFDALSTDNLLSNVKGIVGGSGVEVPNSIVVEEDPESHYGDTKTIVIPYMSMHEITLGIVEAKSHTVFPNAMAVKELEETPEDVKITTLAQTTANSWIRYNFDIESPAYTNEDEIGPAAIAVAIERLQTSDRPAARMVVFGNTYFLTNDNIDAQANFDIFMNAVNWLGYSRDDSKIYPKLINADMLYIRGSDFVRLAIIVIGVMPLAAFAAAFFVWLRRRNL